MNIPNILSLSRIFLIPLFLYLLAVPSVEYRIWALIVFFIASITDFIDGWSARKLGQETEFGKFLDPLADKVLVVATLLALVVLDPFIPLWMVAVIVGRDILITLMRYLAMKRGASLKTTSFGKVKTAFQMTSIGIVILIFIYRPTVENVKMSGIIDMTLSSHPEKWLLVAPYWLIFVVTLLTALSGLHYLVRNGRILLPGPLSEEKADEK
jgi:cardiolipin synthase